MRTRKRGRAARDDSGAGHDEERSGRRPGIRRSTRRRGRGPDIPLGDLDIRHSSIDIPRDGIDIRRRFLHGIGAGNRARRQPCDGTTKYRSRGSENPHVSVAPAIASGGATMINARPDGATAADSTTTASPRIAAGTDSMTTAGPPRASAGDSHAAIGASGTSLRRAAISPPVHKRGH